MATRTDQALGWGLVGLSVAIFIYYTAWIIILPFIDEGQMIHNFFIPRIYAVVIPLTSGVLGLVIIDLYIKGLTHMKTYTYHTITLSLLWYVTGLFVATTLLKSKQKEKKS